MKRKRTILVPHSGTFWVTVEKKFNGVDWSLPHSGLVDRKVTYIVWLGCSIWVGFEESINNFLGCLEGACRVERKISTVVETRCFVDEDRLLL